jgi:hypothetical protein
MGKRRGKRASSKSRSKGFSAADVEVGGFLEDDADFCATVSPFLAATQSGQAGAAVHKLPALAVVPPPVLFASPAECQNLCQGGRKLTDKERGCHTKVNVLMMTLFARSAFMSTRWAPFLPDNVLHSHPSSASSYHSSSSPSNAQHRHHPSCPCGHNSGARLYAHMLVMKNRLMTSSDYIAEGDESRPYDERLANYWASLEHPERCALVEEELKQLKKIMALDSTALGSDNSEQPAFRSWCQCLMCQHRRVSLKDLVEQLHRAFWEELTRYLAMSHQRMTDDGPQFLRTRKSLYRNLTIACRSLLQARSRPVFDIVSELAEYKVNDLPDVFSPKLRKLPDGLTFEADPSTFSDGGDGIFIDGLDDSLFSEGDDGEDDDGDGVGGGDFDVFADSLDYSDDEALVEALGNDLEFPFDEACLITQPVVTAARLSAQEDEEYVREGKELFRFFASELFHHRLVLGYLQKATMQRQLRLLEEEDALERQQVARQEAKKRKRERQKLQRLAKLQQKAAFTTPSPSVTNEEESDGPEDQRVRDSHFEEIESETMIPTPDSSTHSLFQQDQFEEFGERDGRIFEEHHVSDQDLEQIYTLYDVPEDLIEPMPQNEKMITVPASFNIEDDSELLVQDDSESPIEDQVAGRNEGPIEQQPVVKSPLMTGMFLPKLIVTKVGTVDSALLSPALYSSVIGRRHAAESVDASQLELRMLSNQVDDDLLEELNLQLKALHTDFSRMPPGFEDDDCVQPPNLEVSFGVMSNPSYANWRSLSNSWGKAV